MCLIHKHMVNVCWINSSVTLGHHLNSNAVRSVLNWNDSTRLNFYLNGLTYCLPKRLQYRFNESPKKFIDNTMQMLMWLIHFKRYKKSNCSFKFCNGCSFLFFSVILHLSFVRRFCFVLFCLVFCVVLRLTYYKFSIVYMVVCVDI